MVHHSCYLNNSFEADWLLFFLVLGGLQLHLSRTPWRVLRAFSHQLADSRGPEALGPQGLPDLQVAPEHHFQAKAFPRLAALRALPSPWQAAASCWVLVRWNRFPSLAAVADSSQKVGILRLSLKCQSWSRQVAAAGPTQAANPVYRRLPPRHRSGRCRCAGCGPLVPHLVPARRHGWALPPSQLLFPPIACGQPSFGLSSSCRRPWPCDRPTCNLAASLLLGAIPLWSLAAWALAPRGSRPYQYEEPDHHSHRNMPTHERSSLHHHSLLPRRRISPKGAPDRMKSTYHVLRRFAWGITSAICIFLLKGGSHERNSHTDPKLETQGKQLTWDEEAAIDAISDLVLKGATAKR